MSKKHLITCSVMAVLVIISTLNICSVPAGKIAAETVKIPAEKASVPLFTSAKFVLKNALSPEEYSFANETLPTGDARVKFKLLHSLQKHDFKNVGSNMLQSKAFQWFPIIEPILKAYGVPDDFKYVPLVRIFI